MKKTSDFKPGDRVRYTPGIAQGDVNHEACENGIVSSTNGTFVFVRYWGAVTQVLGNPKATCPEDLHLRPAVQ